MELSIGLIGFGNVGKALARLIIDKKNLLRERYDLNISIMGIATRSSGIAIDEHGLDLSRTLEMADQKALGRLHAGAPISDTVKFIQTVPAAVIVELSTLNAETGQPALDHIRLALQLRRHVVSANKGPVAVAYRALREAAEKYQRAFLFESTVMDGTPIFSMARQSLPAIEIQRIRGILNSTTNSILTRMESGASFAEAVKEMQEAGIAEADPSNDIDGWDAAAKIAILASVLMDGDVHPTDVHRIGIGGLTTEELQLAQREGRRIKLVCEAHRDGETIRASVRPTALPGSDPLSQAEGTANIISFETDAIPYLVIHEEGGGPLATAYGVLADLIHIARGTYQ